MDRPKILCDTFKLWLLFLSRSILPLAFARASPKGRARIAQPPPHTLRATHREVARRSWAAAQDSKRAHPPDSSRNRHYSSDLEWPIHRRAGRRLARKLLPRSNGEREMAPFLPNTFLWAGGCVCRERVPAALRPGSLRPQRHYHDHTCILPSIERNLQRRNWIRRGEFGYKNLCCNLMQL